MTTGQACTKLSTDLQGKPTASATANLSDDALYVNVDKTELTVYKVNGSNCFRLRDLGVLLDSYVGYENGTIVIDTSKPYNK